MTTPHPDRDHMLRLLTRVRRNPMSKKVASSIGRDGMSAHNVLSQRQRCRYTCWQRRHPNLSESTGGDVKTCRHGYVWYLRRDFMYPSTLTKWTRLRWWTHPIKRARYERMKRHDRNKYALG